MTEYQERLSNSIDKFDLDDVQKMKNFKDRLIADFSDLCGEGGCEREMETKKCILGPRLFIDRYQNECKKLKDVTLKFKSYQDKTRTDERKLMTEYVTTLWKYEKLKMKHKRLLDDFQQIQKMLIDMVQVCEKL